MEEIKKWTHDRNMPILAISETWLTDDISDGEVNIDDYRLFGRDGKSKPAGGVWIYSLQVELLPVKT